MFTHAPSVLQEDPRPGDIIGGYRITGTLGRGGMAVVMVAEHVETGQSFAIKLMLPHASSDEVRTRFQREFRALFQLAHPNVMRVFETGLWGDRPYFVMELLKGHDLRVESEAWKTLPASERWQRARSVLIQVASALAHIHARGLVHRDITPGNIMVLPGGMVKLMDFGVVKEPGTDLTSVGEVVGTIAYIAPEQILGKPVDERADLYSLGAVLYLMLVGRRPFHATTLAGYLEKHVNRVPKPPKEVVPTVPADLDRACMRLLAKDPDERFASASHLLHFLKEGEPGSADLKFSRWPRRTVGRAGEMAALREPLFQLPSGRGGLVLLEGASGMGKTRLLDDLVALARDRGLPVSRGLCLHSSRRGFAGFEGIYEDLKVSQEGRSDDTLRRVFEVTDDPHAPPPERYAVYAAFLDLLRKSLPRVVVLEDLHRADQGTQELTEYLVRNTLGLASDPVLFVLARWPAQENMDSWHGLVSGETTGVPIRRVTLGPLSRTAVEDLLLSVVPGEPRAADLATRLHQEGEGNPHFIVEMIRGLVDEKVITLDGAGHGQLRDDITTIMRSGLPVPPSIRHALRERLVPLSPSARRVAVTMAVARQEVSIEFLCQVTALDMGSVLGVLDELLECGVIRERKVGAEERFDLSEAGLREVLLDEVDEDDARDTHRRIGLMLERLWRGRLAAVVDLIAWHFEQADLPAKAYPYLLWAGRHLLERAFVAEALEMFDRALKLEPITRDYLTLDDADRTLATLLLHRSRAYAHLGRWESADTDALSAHRIARELKDPHLLAETHFELGSMYRRRTDVEAAEGHFRQAMRLSEESGDQKLRALAMHRVAGQRWARGDLDGAKHYWLEVLTSQDPRATAQGSAGLGLMAICKGNSADARKYLEQAVKTFEEIGAVNEATYPRLNLVELYHLTGNLRRGLETADRLLSQAREIHLQEGIALGLRYRALILVDLGRLEEALAHTEDALKRVRALGNREEELGAYFSMARIAFCRGRPGEAGDWVAKADPLLEKYDIEGLTPIFHAWKARLAALRKDVGGVQRALRAAEEAEGRKWPIYLSRVDLIAARALMDLDARPQARVRALSAREHAGNAGYRYYSLKANILLARLSEEPAEAEGYQRVVDALTRSLVANLQPDDARTFTEFHAGDCTGF